MNWLVDFPNFSAHCKVKSQSLMTNRRSWISRRVRKTAITKNKIIFAIYQTEIALNWAVEIFSKWVVKLKVKLDMYPVLRHYISQNFKEQIFKQNDENIQSKMVKTCVTKITYAYYTFAVKRQLIEIESKLTIRSCLLLKKSFTKALILPYMSDIKNRWVWVC